MPSWWLRQCGQRAGLTVLAALSASTGDCTEVTLGSFCTTGGSWTNLDQLWMARAQGHDPQSANIATRHGHQAAPILSQPLLETVAGPGEGIRPILSVPASRGRCAAYARRGCKVKQQAHDGRRAPQRRFVRSNPAAPGAARTASRPPAPRPTQWVLRPPSDPAPFRPYRRRRHGVASQCEHGERIVGSWQAGDPQAAFAHFGENVRDLSTNHAVGPERIWRPAPATRKIKPCDRAGCRRHACWMSTRCKTG